MASETPRTPEGGGAGRPRRFSRRGFLAGLAAAAAAGVGGTSAALLLTRRGSSRPAVPPAEPAATSPSPSREASPAHTPPSRTARPTATPEPVRGLDLIEPSPGAFEEVLHGPGEPIAWTGGIFFMDTMNGAIRGYRLTAGEDHGTLATSPDAGIVLGSANNVNFLLNRATGASWQWPGLLLRLLAASRERLLFAQIELDNRPEAIPDGHFFFIDRDFNPASMVDLALPLPRNPRGVRPIGQQRSSPSAVLLDGAEAFALLEDDDRTSLQLWRVGRFGVAERIGGDTLAIAGYERQGVRMETIGRGREVLLVAHYVRRDGVGDPASPLRFRNRRFRWSGDKIAFEDAGGLGLDLAPEGDLMAWQEELHPIVVPDLGAPTGWPAVVVADAATGEPRFRVPRLRRRSAPPALVERRTGEGPDCGGARRGGRSRADLGPDHLPQCLAGPGAFARRRLQWPRPRGRVGTTGPGRWGPSPRLKASA